jgi:hypothetical protein
MLESVKLVAQAGRHCHKRVSDLATAIAHHTFESMQRTCGSMIGVLACLDEVLRCELKAIRKTLEAACESVGHFVDPPD